MAAAERPTGRRGRNLEGTLCVSVSEGSGNLNQSIFTADVMRFQALVGRDHRIRLNAHSRIFWGATGSCALISMLCMRVKTQL